MKPHNPPGEEKKQLDAEAARIASLIAGFLRGTLTPAEHEELDRWVEASDRNMQLFEELSAEEPAESPFLWTDSGPQQGRPFRTSRAISTSPLLRTLYSFAGTAAAVLLLLLAAWWYLRPGTPAATPRPDAPGATRLSADSLLPVLTLGNGSRIPLPPYGDTFLVADGIPLEAGPEGVVYRPQHTPSAAPTHALSTPARRTVRVALEDGTRVWLNSSSRLRYPARFRGTAREVTLEGEAWFEVAHRPGQPFVVRTRGLELRVLGTAFNVEAYTQTVTTTLVEGRLAVRNGKDTALLAPGEQLHAAPGRPWRTEKHTDVAAALAWQSGLFIFRGATIRSIGTQLGRWYGCELVVQDSLPYHVTATLPRDLPLSRVLAILELTGRVRFRLQGRTLVAEEPLKK